MGFLSARGKNSRVTSLWRSQGVADKNKIGRYYIAWLERQTHHGGVQKQLTHRVYGFMKPSPETDRVLLETPKEFKSRCQ